MSRAKRELTVPDYSSLDLQALLGPPPLLDGEDPAAYEALKNQIRKSVCPCDAIEEIWVRDVVDIVWETLRLRRLKAKFLRANAHQGLLTVLNRLNGAVDLSKTVKNWTRGNANTKEIVSEELKSAGLDHEAVVAETLVRHISTMERVDQMIVQAEGRRNVVLREIDRHRDAVARRLREAVAGVEDAQFEEIAHEGATQ